MKKNIKVSSLTENERKELMKQGDTVKVVVSYDPYAKTTEELEELKEFHKEYYPESAFPEPDPEPEPIIIEEVDNTTPIPEVYCPKGYQILFYDPNLLSRKSEDEKFEILTYENYLAPNISKSKRLANNDEEFIDELFDGICKEYDNFPSLNQSEIKNYEFLSRQGLLQYFKDTDFKGCASKSKKNCDGIVTTFLKDLTESFKNELQQALDDLNVLSNPKEDYKKIMDLLRLRLLKMKNGKSYVRKQEVDTMIIKKSYLKKDLPDLLKDPSEYTRDKSKEVLNQEIQKLSAYIKKSNDKKVQYILSKYIENTKHIKDYNDLVSILNSLEKLIQELNNLDGDLSELLNEIQLVYNTIWNLDTDYFYYLYPHPNMLEAVREIYDKKSIEAVEKDIYEKGLLKWYEENSVENQNKLKNQSEAFWPIDINGKELNWEQDWPIVMVKKEE